MSNWWKCEAYGRPISPWDCPVCKPLFKFMIVVLVAVPLAVYGLIRLLGAVK